MRLWCLVLLVAVTARCATVGPWQKEGGTKPELTQEEKETLTPEQQKQKLAENEKLAKKERNSN